MATNEQDTCPYCKEYAMPEEWIALRAENARLREALQSIKDQLYQKDQEEITRINDAYDVARAALAGSR